MSIYRYEGVDGTPLVFISESDRGEVQVTVQDPAGAVIPFEDVPRVALELLKAAGHDDLALNLLETLSVKVA